YFNHKTGKAEKCTFCYPRLEVGIPTVCAETCVGRLRYIGIMLYDPDKVLEAASVEDEHALLEAQRGVFLDPYDPEVQQAALEQGIAADWIEAAKQSPVRRLILDYRVALPLHPEYRTMPMVWYIPPLSPVVDALRDSGNDAEDAGNLFGAIDALRIPIEYLANLFTAGDVRPVRESLDKLAAMRSYMRDLNLGREGQEPIAEAVGMTGAEVQEMFRLLAIAKYDERYVIPTAHAEQGHYLEELGCSLDTDGGPGMGGGMQSALGEGAGKPIPVAIATFAEAKARQQADTMEQADQVDYRAWDGSPIPGMTGHQGGNTSPGAGS
ncbi:MAG TPA: nitrate reductase subunit beta, partial [Propionibacteriaceae bacterium]|nr:nitrate reductase subunit beta [Propionibacteriaceae bacterium]